MVAVSSANIARRGFLSGAAALTSVGLGSGCMTTRQNQREIGYGPLPNGGRVVRIRGGTPKGMAANAAGTLVAIADGAKGVEVIDRVSNEVIYKVGTYTGGIVRFEDGNGPSVMGFSHDQESLIWAENHLIGDGREVVVRQLSLSDGAVEAVSATHETSDAYHLLDTPDGLFVCLMRKIYHYSGGARRTLDLDGLDGGFYWPNIVMTAGGIQVVAQFPDGPVRRARFNASRFSPSQELPVIGAFNGAAQAGSTLWAIASGGWDIPGQEIKQKLFAIDPETLRLKRSYGFDAGRQSPSSIVSGPNGVFMANLQSELFRLTDTETLAPPLRIPISTTPMFDTEAGLFGCSPLGVWFIAAEDLARNI